TALPPRMAPAWSAGTAESGQPWRLSLAPSLSEMLWVRTLPGSGGPPGLPGHLLGEAQQWTRRELAGQALPRRHGAGGLVALPCAGRGLRLPQVRVGLPVRLAGHPPCVPDGAPGRRVIGPVRGGLLGGGQRPERGNGGLSGAGGVGDGPCPLREGDSLPLPGLPELARP